MLFLVFLILSTFWVLSPFLTAMLWATIVGVATWPFFLRLRAYVGGRRGLAVTMMTVMILLVVFVPVTLAIATIARNARNITAELKSLESIALPAPPGLYWSGQTVSGTILLIIGVIAAAIDNVVRPVLIRRGANLPLLLIFAGVIGGLIAFGVIGLFIGPVVLTVAYTLFATWVSEAEPDADGTLPRASGSESKDVAAAPL